MHEIEQWIEAAARNQSIKIRKLLPDDAKYVLRETIARYAKNSDPRSRVLWLDLAKPVDEYYDRKTVKFVDIAPSKSGSCWLIPETNTQHAIDLTVYELYVSEIEKLIDDCFGFEYNVVAGDFSWLVIETDHDQYYVCRDSDFLLNLLS